MSETQTKSKYASQLKYDKNRKETDPEYRAKKNAQVKNRNKERYANDPEYRERVKEKSRLRNKMIQDFYKTNKMLDPG